MIYSLLYLYLIKLATFLASKLCGVVVREGRVRFRMTLCHGILFSLFLFFIGFFYNDINRLENGNSWRELTKEKAGICRYL